MSSSFLRDGIVFFRTRAFGKKPLIDTRKLSSGRKAKKGVFLLHDYRGRDFVRARNQWQYLQQLIPTATQLDPEEYEWWGKVFDKKTWGEADLDAEKLASYFRPGYPRRRTPLEAAGCTYGESMAYRLKAMNGPLGEAMKLIPVELLEQLLGALMPYLLANAGLYPEIFGKGNFAERGHIVGPGGQIGMRFDSEMALVEPEFGFGFNARAELAWLFLCNDQSESMLEKIATLLLHLSKCGKASAFVSPLLVLPEPIPLTSKRNPIPDDAAMQVTIWDEKGEPIEALQGSYTWGKTSRDWQDIAFHAMADRDISAGLMLSSGTGWAHNDKLPLKPGYRVGMCCAELFPSLHFFNSVVKHELSIPMPDIVKANYEAKRNTRLPVDVFRKAAEAAGLASAT